LQLRDRLADAARLQERGAVVVAQERIVGIAIDRAREGHQSGRALPARPQHLGQIRQRRRAIGRRFEQRAKHFLRQIKAPRRVLAHGPLEQHTLVRRQRGHRMGMPDAAFVRQPTGLRSTTPPSPLKES